jgi:hypothetical protein
VAYAKHSVPPPSFLCILRSGKHIYTAYYLSSRAGVFRSICFMGSEFLMPTTGIDASCQPFHYYGYGFGVT